MGKLNCCNVIRLHPCYKYPGRSYSSNSIHHHPVSIHPQRYLYWFRTHVAGIACGAQYGVSSNCTLCSVKVLNDLGDGTVGGAVKGIDHAVSQCSSSVDSFGSPCVINLSLGTRYNSLLDTAVANAVSNGVVVVVAAGNYNEDACNYSPASTASAITVGWTTITDTRSSLSNWGSCVDVYAPGENIKSAWKSSPTSTRLQSGTSMASPREYHLSNVTKEREF